VASTVAHAGDGRPAVGAETSARSWPAWWPLAALVLLAAVLRFATLDEQSFWYDEAFTPVHVLHSSLTATLRAVSRTENTPPLWYVLIWGWSRVWGTGEVALRSLSALAGVLTVPVAWAIGRELAGRRAAIATAALVAVNPLFVWYSQEARAYGLYVLLAALAILCFVRALADPAPRRLAAFAAAGALALLSHYFAVFLLLPMCAWLLVLGWRRRLWSVLPAVGAIALVGLALLPLIHAQGGHGTQWIENWALESRLEAIPQYYLTSYYGAALGHGIELAVALPILAGVLYGLWRVLEPREERAALIMLLLSACGVLIPIALVAFGADYLAPRNLVAAMIPLTALIAVVTVASRTGGAGPALAALIALACLAITLDIDLSPRLQRGDWRGLAHVIAAAPGAAGSALSTAPSSSAKAAAARVITTVELGSAPLEYYLPPLHNLPAGATVTASEIDETGYLPLRPGAALAPAPGFHLVQHADVHGLILYRFVSPAPRPLAEATLRAHVITEAHPEVLVP
jgi:mannosyltransferase